MSAELIINASLPEMRIALLEEGKIQEIVMERPGDKGIVGNIYKGKVTRVLPGMQAAFVDIGLDKAAFLYVDDVHVHPEVFSDEQSEQEDEYGPEEGTEAAPGSELEPVTEQGPEHVPEHMNESVPEGEAEPSTEPSSEESEGEGEPVEMGPAPDDDEKDPPGTVAPAAEGPAESPDFKRPRRGGGGGGRFQRGGRGGKRFGNRNERGPIPGSYKQIVADSGEGATDRAVMDARMTGDVSIVAQETGAEAQGRTPQFDAHGNAIRGRREFHEKRGHDRRIRSKHSMPRNFPKRTSIDQLLTEGQEVLVQVAKDPIAAKGARLTCHISLAGRHLVCMPTIDHIGVSRRIERDDERRMLRTIVERNRPDRMGFIVRTASGGKDAETWIKTDVDYLSRVWGDICTKAATVTAPALVYEDLNSVVRAVRDWVTEDFKKIIVDSRYYFNEIKEFVTQFMPELESKLELYHGDIPIFDAYGLSTELHRALERKVWLKSGGYIVIDQAEALVAIDINTGRYVGKKNLEDTILKTNLEAMEEIAYQLRLRNCGGIIIIDMIDMERDENRQRVLRALDSALRADRARPTIIGVSELGLIELTRKRTRDTLVRSLCQYCNSCEGKGFVKSMQTVAYEVLREIERAGIDRDTRKILVQAHPEVIDMLAIDERETLDTLEKRYRKQIYLQAVMDFHQEQFEVSGEQGDRSRPRGHSTARSYPQPKRREESDESAPRPVIIPVSRPVAESTEKAAGEAVVDDRGEVAVMPEVSPIQPGAGNGTPPVKEHDYDEEDRLAFLRAQAAQDAAVAKFAAGETARPSSAGGGGPRPSRGGFDRGGRGGRGGGGGRRDRGGGRNFRRGSGGGRPMHGRPRLGPGRDMNGAGPVVRPVTVEPKADPQTSSSGGTSDSGGSDPASGHSTPV